MKTKTDANTAIARGRDLPISSKMSMEICNNIRYKKIDSALGLLDEVIEMKKPIVIRRFNWDLGHKPGYGPGRYPINAVKAFIQLLKLAKANAENKGLNADKLVVSFAKADFGQRRGHHGRHRGKMKSTHVEIHVKEMEAAGKKTAKKSKKINGEKK